MSVVTECETADHPAHQPIIVIGKVKQRTETTYNNGFRQLSATAWVVDRRRRPTVHRWVPEGPRRMTWQSE